MTDTATLPRIDVEDELANNRRHFRTAHEGCAAQVKPGTIVEGNCGKLYRVSGGGRLALHTPGDACDECAASRGLRPCPWC